jgi:hypothetical protein
MKLHQFGFGILSLVSLTTIAHPGLSQNRPPGTASLGEMSCQRTGGSGGYTVRNADVVIGRQTLRIVAYMGANTGLLELTTPKIDPDNPTEVVCRLAGSTERPRFRTLTLSFGFADTDDSADPPATVRLSIYRDGEFYDSQTVTRGQPIRWPIDVTNTRSIALEATCLRLAQGERVCPFLFFFEDVLSE